MTTGKGSATSAEAARRYAIADAIRDHYKPQGPNDSVPAAPVSVAVALADKLDTLVGFWAIDEKPTGSKDPFALRRAALGVIRIILDGELRISFWRMLSDVLEREMIGSGSASMEGSEYIFEHVILVRDRELSRNKYRRTDRAWSFDEENTFIAESRRHVSEDLLSFFADRLKVHLRDEGARHDLIDAVFALSGQDDLLMIVRRVEALATFLDSDDGANLLTGYRRAANILRDEEKKDGAGAFDEAPDHHLIEARGEAAERALFHVMQAAEGHAREHVAAEDFEGAMRALAELRPAVDAFFDEVTVNADDPALRVNRLKLLNMLRQATLTVADFSRIGG